MTRKALTPFIAAVFTAAALPATAGSWPNLPPKKAPAKESTAAQASKPSEPARTARTNEPFEEIGGDTGWQLKQHKYVFADGRLAHSDECDHAIRSAAAPTPTEVERLRNASPGA